MPEKITETESTEPLSLAANAPEDGEYDDCDEPLNTTRSENGGSTPNAPAPQQFTATANDEYFFTPLANALSPTYHILASAYRDLGNGRESLGPLTNTQLNQSLRSLHPLVAAILRASAEGTFFITASVFNTFVNSDGDSSGSVIPANSARLRPSAEPVPPSVSTLAPHVHGGGPSANSTYISHFYEKVQERNHERACANWIKDNKAQLEAADPSLKTDRKWLKHTTRRLETVHEASDAQESGESATQDPHDMHVIGCCVPEEDNQDDAAAAVANYDSNTTYRGTAEDESGTADVEEDSDDSDDSDHFGNAGGPKGPDGSDGSAGDGSSGVDSASNPEATPSNSESAPENTERDAKSTTATTGDTEVKPVANHALAVAFMLKPMALSGATLEPADVDTDPDLPEHQDGGAWLKPLKFALSHMLTGSASDDVWQGLPSLEGLCPGAGLVGVPAVGASAFAA